MTEKEHETHVYSVGRRWFWRCMGCDAKGGDLKRRMDADVEAAQHEADSS